ncbi:hypothetical protein PILCRDRAFT_12872 [Piloderma croceum F 1598]|uniref:G domain-containing protein n=1 Tax=Piloderma croceum (strain F 1598) TaxID=765440 RepID=A0A0C3F8P8_PILCF|nr:hypothetical protein PILCRDRAFT_12872 [Piloderma croceum F 1598]
MSTRISQDDKIVIVMGLTGAGKSKFIEYATGSNGNSVGHSWRSHTSDIQTVRAVHPANGGPVVFVDTPGFDGTFKSDEEILAIIVDWLTKAKKAKVSTILYLHRMSDNRMSQSATKNIRLFRSICGKHAMPNVVIVTTMWSKVGRKDGIDREDELKKEVWHEMLDDGCKIERFEDTRESAWRIVCNIMKNPGASLLIQDEMTGDTQESPIETTASYYLAGTAENNSPPARASANVLLSTKLEKLIKGLKIAVPKLKLAMKSARPQYENMVVVMGLTGVGKSQFIERATRSNGDSVGHSWRSRTSDVRAVRAVNPANGSPVVFVDTPGFNDTFKSDEEILTIITDWLTKAKKAKVSTILYLHRMSDNRMSGSAMKNLQLFRSICDKKAMPNVAIVTTMWSKVGREDGILWEEVLKKEVWDDMVVNGCKIERFEDTYQSAWDIVNKFF